MKTPSIGILNTIGFKNSFQKILFAASILKAATLGGGRVVLVPAARAIVANPLAVPPILARAAVAEVAAPLVIPVKGWSESISITYAIGSISLLAYLPYSATPGMLGASTATVDGISELSASSAAIPAWLGSKASLIPEQLVFEPLTLEKYFYKYALQAITADPAIGTIEEGIYENLVPCKVISITLPTVDYDLNSADLQLAKVKSNVSEAEYIAYLLTFPPLSPQQEFSVFVTSLLRYHEAENGYWFMAEQGTGVDQSLIFSSTNGTQFTYYHSINQE